MRKVILMIITVAMVICLCAGSVAFAAAPLQTVRAAEPTPTPEPPSASPAADASNVFIIDNANVYQGMDRPYTSGYVPTVSGGAANIVLPLLPNYPVRSNQVNVSVNLGDATSSPFQFGNYDQSISLMTHPTNNGDKEAYLINLVIPLSAERKNGSYPVTMTVTGALEDGTAFTQDFPVYVTITDGIDPNATPTPEPTIGPEPTEAPIPEPKVMISSYTISPTPVVAGEKFTAMVTLKNTDESQTLNNVKVTVKGDTTDFLPATGETGSFFFDKIAPGGDITFGIDMTAAQNSKPEPHKLVLSIVYDGAKAQKYSGDEEIVVPVSQPIRLEFDEPKIEKELNAGDTIPVSMNVMNLGLSTVHNVRMTVEAPGLIPDKTAFIGNIESGASKKGEIYVFVGTLDMTDGGSSEEKYGATAGMVNITYEDEFGQEYTKEFEFETYINPPVIVETPEEETEADKPQNTSQWWISIIIAAAIILAIVFIRLYIVKKQKKLRDAEEAEADAAYISRTSQNSISGRDDDEGN